MNKSVGLHDESATLERDLDAARSVEIPDAAICLKLARTYARMDQEEEAYAWLVRVVDAGDSFRSWSAAASLLSKLREEHVPASKRLVRVAVTGTYTTTQLSAMLRLAALRAGIDVGLYEGGFGQYRQDLLDPASAMYAFGVEYVVLATHDRALELPLFSDDPERHVAAEIGRWTSLWDALDQQSDARLIQHTFAIRPEAPFGHLSRSLPGSRYAMTAAVNVGIGEAAAGRVSIVDCERLASDFGKSRWFDDRYWHGAKQAVALDAVPMVARHTAAVLGACLGLSRKCLVLDLDNTLWGGVVGEDGLAGIELGAGVAGEAYVAFQRYLLELKERGVILAVVSKNNDADAREPFERHPDMAISLDDVAVFIANWEDKPTNIRHVAETLNVGLDALVLVDDNPVERQFVRQLLPEVDVVALPPNPSGYVRALSEYLRLEPNAFTREDRDRTAQYRARAQALVLQTSASSIEDFYRSLKMRALIAPFDELHLARIAQLIAKTNQFNLTTRRHDIAAVRQLMADEEVVHLYLKLADTLADHGLVAVLIARRDDNALDIDTWLMSCRVIGRTVEHAMVANLCRRARELGCSILRGTYVASAKNAIVADLYPRLGFELVSDVDGNTAWEYDIAAKGAIRSEFIDESEDAAGVG